MVASSGTICVRAMALPKWLWKHRGAFCVLIFAVCYFGFPALMLFCHRDTGSSQQVPSAGNPLGDLRIEGPCRRWSNWSRNDAIKFAFDQLDSQITLVLTAAAALIAAIAKIVVDSLGMASSPKRTMTRAQVLVAAVICAFSSWSLFFGIVAKSYFPRLADAAQFSMYKDLGTFALHQIIWFFVGLLILASMLLVSAWAKAA